MNDIGAVTESPRRSRFHVAVALLLYLGVIPAAIIDHADATRDGGGGWIKLKLDGVVVGFYLTVVTVLVAMLLAADSNVEAAGSSRLSVTVFERPFRSNGGMFGRRP